MWKMGIKIHLMRKKYRESDESQVFSGHMRWVIPAFASGRC